MAVAAVKHIDGGDDSSIRGDTCTCQLTSLTCSLPNFLAALGAVFAIASSLARASLRSVAGVGSRSTPLAGSLALFAFGFAAVAAAPAVLLPPPSCAGRTKDCRIFVKWANIIVRRRKMRCANFKTSWRTSGERGRLAGVARRAVSSPPRSVTRVACT